MERTFQMRLKGTSHTKITSTLMETEIRGRSWLDDVGST
jgi:hypothetical protein